jgi:hypothetical protein
VQGGALKAATQAHETVHRLRDHGSHVWGSIPLTGCDHRSVRFTVTIQGAGWTDVQQLELPRLPREGELIETKYGTCQVTHSEATPEADPVAGKIVCSIS